ncbi:VOC family protein [Streptomyces sp. NPDC089922]|uniref:VOC family protein n=2 Tax=unclassified Streptomyces TaxID=2593676 RepID=UPI003420BB47
MRRQRPGRPPEQPPVVKVAICWTVLQRAPVGCAISERSPPRRPSNGNSDGENSIEFVHGQGIQMITHIASTTLYVTDQDESLAFYRDVLGFELITDVDMGGGARWLEVRPTGAQTSVVLSKAEAFDKSPGEGAYLIFAADDVAATVAELRERGATVTDPKEEPWGTYALVDAPDGHKLHFNQRAGR